MKPSKRQRIRDIYAGLPTIACSGACANACGPIPVARLEQKMMGPPDPAIDQNSIDCPHLSSAGACKIYDRRPLVCRLFGVAEGLECPHGCERKAMLTRRQAHALMAEVRKIGGDLRIVCRNGAFVAVPALEQQP